MSTPTIHHQLFDTAIGECGVAWNSRGLVGVQLPEKDRGGQQEHSSGLMRRGERDRDDQQQGRDAERHLQRRDCEERV